MDSIKKKQLEILDILIEIDKVCRKHELNYYLAYGSALGAVRHKGFIPWDKDIDIIIEIEKMDEFLTTLESNLPKKYAVYSVKNDDKYDSLKPRVGLSNRNHHTLHVDIFPMVGISNNYLARKTLPLITSFLYTVFFLKKFDSDSLYKNNYKKRIKHKFVKMILCVIPISLIKKVFTYFSWRYPIYKSSYIYNICAPYGTKDVIPKDYLGEAVYVDFEEYNLPIPKEWDEYLKHLYGDYMTPVKY